MSFFLGCYVIILIYNLIKGKKAMHMLQQNLYNENNRYVKWLDKNLKVAFVHFDLLTVLCFFIAMMVHNEYSNMLFLVGLVFYFIDAYLIIRNGKQEQVKKPLVVTARVRRLIVTSFILFFSPAFIYFTDQEALYFSLFIVSILTAGNFGIIYLAKVVNTPVEKLVYLKFYRQAQ